MIREIKRKPIDCLLENQLHQKVENAQRMLDQVRKFEQYAEHIKAEKVRIKYIELENQLLKNLLVKKIVEVPIVDLSDVAEKINDVHHVIAAAANNSTEPKKKLSKAQTLQRDIEAKKKEIEAARFLDFIKNK